jgi:glycosyltransferase involved in cell wall biosynthesis
MPFPDGRFPRFEPVDDQTIPAKVAELLSRPTKLDTYDLDAKFPRTLHCIGTLSAGGAERQLVNLLVGLAERGHHEQTLLTVYPLEGPGAHYTPLLKGASVDLRVNNSPIREEGIELIRRNFEICQAIKALPITYNAWVMDLWVDIALARPLVAHMWLDHCNLWGGMAAALAGVPAVVLSTRNVHPMNFPYMSAPYMRGLYSWLEQCPRVHFLNNSQPGAESYAEWIGCPTDRIEVILNGVNFAHLEAASAAERAAIRSEIGIPADAPVVVGAFRLSEEKRPELFVETFAKAKAVHPSAHAVLMGEGPYLEAVLAKASELGVGDSFHAIGRRADLPKVMTAMDVFLHTAWWEGTPNVVLEAQQLSMPVVVTTAGGAIHAVREGVTGHLVDKTDAEALAAALIDVLNDLPGWREKAKAGPAFVQKRFGVDRMIDETLALQKRAIPRDSDRARRLLPLWRRFTARR